MTENRRRHGRRLGSRAPHAQTPARTHAGSPSRQRSRAPCGAWPRSCRGHAESRLRAAHGRPPAPAHIGAHQSPGAKRERRSCTAPVDPRLSRSFRPPPVPACRIGAAGLPQANASPRRREAGGSWRGGLRLLFVLLLLVEIGLIHLSLFLPPGFGSAVCRTLLQSLFLMAFFGSVSFPKPIKLLHINPIALIPVSISLSVVTVFTQASEVLPSLSTLFVGIIAPEIHLFPSSCSSAGRRGRVMAPLR